MKKIFFIAIALFNNITASDDFETILKATSKKRILALQDYVKAYRETRKQLAAFQGITVGIILPRVTATALKQELSLFDAGFVLCGLSHIRSDVACMKVLQKELKNKIDTLKRSLGTTCPMIERHKMYPNNRELVENFVAGLMLASIVYLPAKAIFDRHNFSEIDLAAHSFYTVPIALVAMTNKLLYEDLEHENTF